MEQLKPIFIDYVLGKNNSPLPGWDAEPFNARGIRSRIIECINDGYLIFKAQGQDDVKDREEVALEVNNNWGIDNDELKDDSKNDSKNDVSGIRHYIRTQSREMVIGFMPSNKIDDFCLRLLIHKHICAIFRDPKAPKLSDPYLAGNLCYGNETYPFAISRYQKALTEDGLKTDNWEALNKISAVDMTYFWDKLSDELRGNGEYTLVICLNGDWDNRGLLEIISHCLCPPPAEEQVTENVVNEINFLA